jgi:hypothetical protein
MNCIIVIWSHEPEKLEWFLECLNSVHYNIQFAVVMDITSAGDPMAHWVAGLIP